MARPMPLPPPVTTATCPSNVPSASIGLGILYHARVQGDGAVGRDEQRIDLDLGDGGMRGGDARERDRSLGRRTNVARPPPAGTRQERRPRSESSIRSASATSSGASPTATSPKISA